jgi:glucosyl-dolichyl phosphate glucuronosyltransferase
VNATIILCTYNRCQSLAKALESVASLRLPEPDAWEVLIVDNNSNDKTSEVALDFCRRYPAHFRYIFEPCQGKSNALNTGIGKAHGDVLAFTDDDVILEPTWLQNLIAPLRDSRWAGAGGRTLPEQNFSPPPWLSLESRYALGPLAIFDLGSLAAELTESPFGNNMAFRKQTVEKYGGFRTDLGPQPGSEIRSEDTEFGRRLLAAGERLRYEPSAVVYHAVPESRIRKDYFLAWWSAKAQTEIRESDIGTGTRWKIQGIPMVLFRRLTRWTMRWMVAVRPSGRFFCKIHVWMLAGQIAECWRRSRQTDSQKTRVSYRASP